MKTAVEPRSAPPSVDVVPELISELDLLRMPFYSSRRSTGWDVPGSQFDLGRPRFEIGTESA